MDLEQMVKSGQLGHIRDAWMLDQKYDVSICIPKRGP